MTERMQNNFVVRDTNHKVSWSSPDGGNSMMTMDDGSYMEAAAFKDKTPMLDFTPAELGINMSAFPGHEEMPENLSAKEAAQIESSQNPFDTPIQQDLATGGVQFGSEGTLLKKADGIREKAQAFVQDNAYSILMGGLLIFAGYWLRGKIES